MSFEIAEQWLNSLAETANTKKLDEHMSLISRKIRLYGVPGFETIGFDDWHRQCGYEFENNILKSVQYEGLQLLEETNKAIRFRTFETVEGTDGIANAHGVEILLEHENDGYWRMVMQRIMSDEETAKTGVLPQYLQE